MIDENEVKKLAVLSRLQLTEGNISEYTTHLQQMVEYFEPLCREKMEGVEPLLGVDRKVNAIRPDTPQPSLEEKSVFANAPEVEFRHFVVPKVMP